MLTMEQDVSNQIHFRNINIPVPVPPSLLPPLCSHLCSHIHARALIQPHTYKYMHTQALADTLMEADTAYSHGVPTQTYIHAVQVKHTHR